MTSTKTETAQTALYRGWTNNGVTTVLTQEAVDALERFYSVFKGDEKDPEIIELRLTIARGTFTFVHAGESYDEYYRWYVTGTYEDLDAWTAGRTLHLFGSSNPVPHSNGNDDEERKHFAHSPADIIKAFGLRWVE